MTSNDSYILVIDDDEQFLDTLRCMLEEAGHEVRTAGNGAEGLRVFREQPADLIITDILMPDKDGMEMIAELRREFSGVKIFAISGGGDIIPEHYLDTAALFGALRTFAKPIRREMLLSAIEEVLGG